ncbi:hypothetical protein [Novosphingobium sp. AP12]|uniref:hypothetical protein n=1 Tax=Novosphingobium sp. AP12 TaxID=1144305 RepID=UPI0012F8C2EE|nr:hypothetical protein [Novosphingobium sp. AP12]
MATTLRDFIAQRETEIRDQQKALKAELRELQIAKAALGGQASPPSSAPSGATATIKEMARQVLSGQTSGLNSSGILDAIKKEFGRDIERTSLSPQLSRLKEEGELILNGEVWFTTSNFKTIETQWGNPAPPVNGDFGSGFDDDSEIPF